MSPESSRRGRGQPVREVPEPPVVLPLVAEQGNNDFLIREAQRSEDEDQPVDHRQHRQ